MTNALARAHSASDSTFTSQTFNVQTFVMAQPALIEASAGTGKTYSITNLVLRALLGVGTRETCLSRPLEVDELLIVTFTNAATADLRQRIYERIRSARLALEEFITLALNQVVEQLKDPKHGGHLAPNSARIVAAKAKKRGAAAHAGTAADVVLLSTLSACLSCPRTMNKNCSWPTITPKKSSMASLSASISMNYSSSVACCKMTTPSSSLRNW